MLVRLIIKTFISSIIVIFSLLLLITISGTAFLSFSPVFGDRPDQHSQQKMEQSTHFNGESFDNLIPTQISTRTENSPSIWSFLLTFLLGEEGKNPEKPLPSLSITSNPLKENEMIWLGHSTTLFSTRGLNIITDPVFYRASPLPIGGSPFELNAEVNIEQLPNIDVVLISHDHYDHLDMYAIKEMSHKVNRFFVPLGVKAHLLRWGVTSEKITELEWYESISVNGVSFIFTPSRHFSGRGLFDRMKTLWGSWIINSPTINVYFSGDGGYSPEFKKIGEQYGPFDLAIMENGAYDENWSQIHMFPEENIKAAQELKAQHILPIHWGKYDLANHHWLEPIIRLSSASKKANMSLITPIIGQPFNIKNPVSHQWWLTFHKANQP